MKNKLIQTIGAGFAASTVVASAAGGAGDWCDSLKDIGKVYKDKKNPIIQEVKFFGRAHYQWGYTDGDYNGRDFSGNGDELRRLRFGTSIKFLNGFKAVARVNLERRGFRDTSIGYANFDELYLDYNFGDVGCLEKVKLGYGRYKVAFGGEEHTSSKKIKTVERSNLNNIFAPRRATGVKLNATTGGIDWTFGVYSADRDLETWGQWNGGVGYHASAEFEALNGDFTADLLYTDASTAQNAAFRGVDWAASLTYETEFGGWDLFTNATYGDAGASDVWGIVIMPSTYIIEDKLEAVFRYQWAHSSGNFIRPNSRNIRNVGGNETPAVPIGRGDDNHSLYAGLNYYLCGNNMKVMTGVEFETLDNDAGTVDLEATTFWAAFRAYF